MTNELERRETVRARVEALAFWRPSWRPLAVGEHRFEIASCSGERLLDDLIAADPAHPAVRDERLPYWTEVWPSAVAVAAAALAPDARVAGLRTLDLGCGLGVAGLAAGRAGARVVLADYDPAAVRFAALNWAANLEAPPEAVVMDWREPAFGPVFDLILAADIVYEKRYFEPVLRAFDNLLAPGGSIWLAEPDRPFSTGFFPLLAAAGYRWSRQSMRVFFPNPAKPTDVGLYTIKKID